MSPAVKYTVGRIGLFLVCALVAFVVLPKDLNPLLPLLAALLVSMPLSFFLMRDWRAELETKWEASRSEKQAERKALRDALAGKDTDASS